MWLSSRTRWWADRWTSTIGRLLTKISVVDLLCLQIFKVFYSFREDGTSFLIVLDLPIERGYLGTCSI